MTYRLFMALIGLGFLSALHWGGAGGCGSSAGGTGEGATATTESTAASRGAVTGATSGLTSALNSVTGIGAALRLKAVEEDDDLGCAEDEDGDIDCGDRDEGEDEGHVNCDFEDSATEEECGEAGSIFTFDTNVTMTFEDFSDGDECGQEVVLNGTVTGHVEATYDECADSSSATGSFQTSDLTITLEDGTSHAVTFDLNFTLDDETETVSGEVCVDGACSDVDSLDDLSTTECEELENSEDDESSCEFAECSMDANEDGVSDDPDHFECQLFAEDDPGDEFETDNVTCSEGCCVLDE